MGDDRGRSRRLVAVLALERSDGARAFVRFAGRFLANGSPPAKVRQAHVPKAERTKRPSASPSRRGSRTQFAALHAHGFAAERRPRIRQIPTAIQGQTRRVTNRPSEDPGPCRHCAAALSCSADAPTCITLGSHARSGPRLRRSPQRAVPCGRRHRASLSPTDAPEPTAWSRGSARPHHRLQGWNRVALPRRDGRIPAGFRRPVPTAIQWQTRRVTNRPSDDPGPCRRCAAALTCSADAPTCITLGSHARSGLRMRRSPQSAVPCGPRNRASLSATYASNPAAWRRGSAHPDHRLRGWNRVASPRRVGRIPAGFRRPDVRWQHEASRIVHPKIPDLAAAVRQLSAARRTHPHIYRSDRTPGPVCACAARREGPSHADIEMALRCRPRTPATTQLGGEAAPIQIIA